MVFGKKTKRSRRNQLVDDAVMLGGASIATGTLSTVTTQVGGDASGLQAFSQQLPVVGATLGAKNVLGEVRKVRITVRKKRRK